MQRLRWNLQTCSFTLSSPNGENKAHDMEIWILKKRSTKLYVLCMAFGFCFVKWIPVTQWKQNMLKGELSRVSVKLSFMKLNFKFALLPKLHSALSPPHFLARDQVAAHLFVPIWICIEINLYHVFGDPLGGQPSFHWNENSQLFIFFGVITAHKSQSLWYSDLVQSETKLKAKIVREDSQNGKRDPAGPTPSTSVSEIIWQTRSDITNSLNTETPDLITENVKRKTDGETKAGSNTQRESKINQQMEWTSVHIVHVSHHTNKWINKMNLEHGDYYYYHYYSFFLYYLNAKIRMLPERKKECSRNIPLIDSPEPFSPPTVLWWKQW